MLRHPEHQRFLADEQRMTHQEAFSEEHHSPSCDDSGVFLEDSVASSPEAARLLQNNSTSKQFSESLDSDAEERSDDLGLASSSVDSADDLDGDPLPSTLHPPPVPARKSKVSDSQKNNRYYRNEGVPNHNVTPSCKSSSSGEDSNFGDVFPNDLSSVTLRENAKNFLNNQRNERNNFAMTRLFHEDTLMNLQLDNSHDSKTLNSSSSERKKLDVLNGNASRNGFKWKSEECLRTAAENKWCGRRRYEKSVSVKDRIAMFSEMEANQSSDKKDRYGSETNIRAAMVESKRMDFDNQKHNSSSKWHSMQSIARKCSDKEVSCSSMKPAVPINDYHTYTSCTTLPVKLDVEAPKPIVSTYPETQLTNNKRYNYGLYSLKNLKNTEDLLSKKSSGSNLLAIIDSRKQQLGKLKGLVIPEKPQQCNSGKDLPTLFSSDSEARKDSRRSSLPMTVVTSLPRDQKLERTSLVEPPWKKNESKYSPAFQKKTLSSPPSSITSPLSPSSPSSICGLQQNVFQFSLSHSKPVQPLQPEKALMSPPPSLPSDVEYEGDNSEDSSSTSSPMRSSKSSFGNNSYQHGKSSTFKSTTRTVFHKPMMVETLTKASKIEDPPRAAVCISKTEIHLKCKKSSQPDSLSRIVAESFDNDSESATKRMEATCISNRNGTTTSYFTSNSRNGSPDISVGKFRALPLNFQEAQTKVVGSKYELENGRPSECEDSDDSRSTISHTTTDDCMSDADSFEKPRHGVGMNAAEGYLSDASTTDVSLRRFAAHSAEEYFSDAESPDPEWIPPHRNNVLRNQSKEEDWRPKRLSQQRTVLKAEPTDSVQKFKALAEKWEQRRTPPTVNGMKKDSVLSTNNSAMNGKLPPSLMPRNSSQSINRTNDQGSSLKKEIIGKMKHEVSKTLHLNSSILHNETGIKNSSYGESRSEWTASENGTEERLIPAELLESARAQLREEGSSSLSSIHHVLLLRRGGGTEGGGVGITLAGGADYEVKEITVHKVISGSLADRNGQVLKGDRVMSINGKSLRGVSHGEALHILKAPNPEVHLVLARNGEKQQQHAPATSNKVAGIFSVALKKDASTGGVGFSIEGGKDSPQGDRPLLIKRVFKGSVADKEGRLEEGDEILAINEHPVNNMTRTEAWNFLKKLPDGFIHLKLKKTS